jgi:WD40 repeat protein
VCQAIQHAHQKGIVHRDLKPTNILVTLYDGRPVPKVIDFGVAKATGGRLTEETLSTQFGAVVGTFEYMAPEQAGFSALDVDTRADVYSLGVILYELLTGLRPFEGSRLRKAAIDELFRILREEEPPRPSTKLSTDASLPSAAAVRRTDPKKLAALMRGELDWIVMKCLEKDRSRRYETVSALARDVERYLADEPVEARPPSAGYRARKFIRRNRGRVVAAALVLLALVAGVIGTIAGLIEARGQRDAARRAEQQADADRALAVSEFRRAEEEGARARAAELELSADGQRLLIRRRPSQLMYRPGNPNSVSSNYDYQAPDVTVWDVPTGKQVSVLPLISNSQDWPSPRFSPDGAKIVYLAPDSGALALYDARMGKLVHPLTGADEHRGAHWMEAAFSPDGQVVVGQMMGDRDLQFWDASTGKRLGSFRNSDQPASRHQVLSFSPDSKHVAISFERVVQIVDVATRTLVRELRGHEAPVLALAFSPDGTRLLTGSEDKTAGLWDGKSGQLLAVYRGHTGGVNLVAFSPDGKRVATAGAAELMARVWNLDVVPEFDKRKPRELTPERVRYELPPASQK